MKTVKQRFIVSGNGSFPLDMLRYDHCWPSSPHDVTQISARDEIGDRNIILERVVEKGRLPTVERWKSFGWKLMAVQDD